MSGQPQPLVRFYVLNRATDPVQRERFACELVAKGLEHGVRHIHIQVHDPQQARRLDTLLWTFRKESFIPHAVQAEAEDEPVVIGDRPEPRPDALLINLAADIPPEWTAFGRVFEVVVQDPEILHTTRSHFRTYQQAGVTPEKHDVR
ncbi:DNA polymerase III subunit chi [Alkalilimnicola ehrlichii MLHE-1]|uniref:DNA polymerase III chi subunit, HolC n=1 Tax=Alkalilimnicola ehrlichii (strain ATCC BAA-1101 / DSM 17681 / MLHE-1) TaxID=187272 RepID=Q0AB76_ALKEH|nr:DNA polymerase III subunit chi [Alkalilimnicola ehrlichii]ABI55911.1 DNA polymerase III chi subunit, HolC [Alkalilimnicola ehrlichii MLHE-1]